VFQISITIITTSVKVIVKFHTNTSKIAITPTGKTRQNRN